MLAAATGGPVVGRSNAARYALGSLAVQRLVDRRGATKVSPEQMANKLREGHSDDDEFSVALQAAEMLESLSSKLDTARLALRDIMSRANPQEWHFQRAHEALKEVGFPK